MFVLFDPFSAFDELAEVVNIDRAIAPGRLTMLIQTSERGVTINKGRWVIMRHH